jgi:hypothetical protein
MLDVGRTYSVAEIQDRFDYSLWMVEERLKAQGRIRQIDLDIERHKARIRLYEVWRGKAMEFNSPEAASRAWVLEQVIRDLQGDIEYLQQCKKDLLETLAR